MEIILLRHAHTESWSDTGQDFDRPLSPEGRQQAQLAGRWIRQQDCVPDQIVASPALRTTQTAQWAAMMAGIPEKEICFERSLYNASPGELLKVIEHYSAMRLMIIAHNPGIEILAEILSGERMRHFSPATIARIELGDDPGQWAKGVGCLLDKPIHF